MKRIEISLRTNQITFTKFLLAAPLTGEETLSVVRVFVLSTRINVVSAGAPQLADPVKVHRLVATFWRNIRPQSGFGQSGTRDFWNEGNVKDT